MKEVLSMDCVRLMMCFVLSSSMLFVPVSFVRMHAWNAIKNGSRTLDSYINASKHLAVSFD